MKYVYYHLLLIFINYPVFSQHLSASAYKSDRKLTVKLENALSGFKGKTGIYVRNLKTDQTASVHADTIFPTASMVKVPIMIGVFDKINKGELKFDEVLTYRDSLKYDDGIVGSFRDSTKIAMPKVIHLMISQSDNTGSLWLQALAAAEQRSISGLNPTALQIPALIPEQPEES